MPPRGSKTSAAKPKPAALTRTVTHKGSLYAAGTPLSKLPGLTEEQVKRLKRIGAAS